MTDLPAVVTKLTKKQHVARATLLGRWYHVVCNTYNSADFIDADTLEPVPIEVFNKRMHAWLEQYR